MLSFRYEPIKSFDSFICEPEAGDPTPAPVPAPSSAPATGDDEPGSKLINALRQEREAREALEKKLKTITEAQEKEKKEKEKKKAEEEGNYNRLEEQLRKDHTEALANFEKEKQALASDLDIAVLDSATYSALAEHDGIPEALFEKVRGVVARVKVGGKFVAGVVEKRNEDGTPVFRLKTGGEIMTAADYVAELKKVPALRGCFNTTIKTGSSTDPSNRAVSDSAGKATAAEIEKLSPEEYVRRRKAGEIK